MLIDPATSRRAFETPDSLYAVLCAGGYGKPKLNINQLPS